MTTDPTPKATADVNRTDNTGTGPTPWSADAFPFLQFHYAYRSVSSDGRHTHVETREARFAEGKFETASFQGVLNPGAYIRFAEDMNRFYLSWMESWMRGFSAWLQVRRQD